MVTSQALTQSAPYPLDTFGRVTTGTFRLEKKGASSSSGVVRPRPKSLPESARRAKRNHVKRAVGPAANSFIDPQKNNVAESWCRRLACNLQASRLHHGSLTPWAPCGRLVDFGSFVSASGRSE